MVLEVANTTYNMQIVNEQALAQMPPMFTWGFGIIIGIIFLIAIFFLVKYFRFLVYGFVPLISLILASLLGHSSVSDAANGDFTLLYWLIGFIVGVPACILIGYFVTKLPFIKKFEKKIGV